MGKKDKIVIESQRAGEGIKNLYIVIRTRFDYFAF